MGNSGYDDDDDDDNDDTEKKSNNNGGNKGPGWGPIPDPPDCYFNYNNTDGTSGVGTIHNYQYYYQAKDNLDYKNKMIAL